jgi:hypothetical protein
MVTKKPARERRTIQIVVRMNKAEREKLRRLARAAELPEAEYLRRLVEEAEEK